MTDETTLLPCPFCGNEVNFTNWRRSGGWVAVECKKCFATSRFEPTEKEAACAWNRRYTEDDLK